MKRKHLLILLLLLPCLSIFIGGWKFNPSWQNIPIEKNEYFIQTDTGVTIYSREEAQTLHAQKDRKAVLLIHGVGVGYEHYDL
jgi:hypothetical protein